MMQLTLEALKKQLESMQLKPIFQEETNQLVVTFLFESIEFPLFFRIYDEGRLLQALTVIPCKIKMAFLDDLSRLLHLINSEIESPGFCIEEMTGVAFYRCMIPSIEGKIPVNQVEDCYNTSKSLCLNFGPIITAVASGISTYADVLNKLHVKKPSAVLSTGQRI